MMRCVARLGRAVVLFSVTLFCGSCLQSVPVSNPYDPDLPPEQQQKATLAGTVYGMESGLPTSQRTLESATLYVSGPTAPSNAPFVTGADGAYNFGELIPGVYTLEVTHPEHYAIYREVTLAPGAVVVADVVLIKLSATVGDTTGRISGIIHQEGQLALPTASQDHSGVVVEVIDAGIRSVSNQGGQFDLFLNPGTYDLRFSANGYLSLEVYDVVVVAGDTTEVTGSPLSLVSNPGRVVGVVTLEEATAGNYGGVILSLQNTSYTTQSAADGTFALNGVAEGIYALFARVDNYDAGSALVTVRAGSDTDVGELSLALSRGSIRGRVTLLNETDHGGAQVIVTGTSYMAISSSTGSYEIEGVPVGVYEVSASKDEFSTVSVGSITVTGNDITDIDTLTLSRQEGDFAINGGASYVDASGVSPGVTLDLDFVGPPEEMRISQDSSFADAGLGNTDYIAYDSAPGFQLKGLDGRKTLYVQVRAGGVESAVFSSSIILDRVAPTSPTVRINAEAEFTSSALVTVYFSAVDDNPIEYQISAGTTAAPTSWRTLVGSETQTLLAPTTEEVKPVSVMYRDAAHNQTAEVTATIKLDLSRPSVTAFTVTSDGALPGYTNSPVVQLTIAGEDTPTGLGRVDYMALANETSTAESFESYSTSRSWLLTPADGLKTIRLNLMDAAGNITLNPSERTVRLDRTAPSVTLAIVGTLADATTSSMIHTSSNPVTLQITAADTYGVNQLWIANDLSFSGSSSEDYTASTTWSLSPGEGQKTVYVKVSDNAGNIALASATILVDMTSPTSATVALDPSDYTTSGSVDAFFSVVGATERCVYGDISGGPADCEAGSSGWAAFTDDATLTLSGGEGLKTVSVRYRDAARFVTDVISASVYRDTADPTVGTVVLTGKIKDDADATDLTATSAVTVTLSGFSDGSGSGITEMMVSQDPAFSGAVWQTYSTSFQWLLAGSDGSKTVRVKVRDAAGRESVDPPASGAITLDRAPPTGGEVQVSSGADYTNVASAVVAYKILGNAVDWSVTGTTWIACTGTCPTALTTLSGHGIVYTTQGPNVVQLFFRDRAGNVSAPFADTVFFDNIAPTDIRVQALSPRSTALYIDLEMATDPGTTATASGVAYYEVAYKLDSATAWPTESLRLATSTGYIPGLTAMEVYDVRARAVDHAGNYSNQAGGGWSAEATALVGLTTNVAAGVPGVGTIGSQVQTHRGFYLFPTMAAQGTAARLVSCDARTGRCADNAFADSQRALTADGHVCAASTAVSKRDIAFVSQGLDAWLFATCTVGTDYAVYAMHAGASPDAIPDLEQWTLFGAGTVFGSQTPTSGFNVGRASAAAASGKVVAHAMVENVLDTPLIKVRTCYTTGDCSVDSGWSIKSITVPSASYAMPNTQDEDPTYLDMDAGPKWLWLAYPGGGAGGAGAVAAMRCDVTTSTCSSNTDWRFMLLGVGRKTVAARVLDLGDAVYVAALNDTTAESGVYVWRCAATSGCDEAGDFAGALVQPLSRIKPPASTVAGPRLSFEWAADYLYFSAIDYQTGAVYVGRCEAANDCTKATNWSKNAAFQTPTVDGQADLGVLHGNTAVFVSRDATHAYVLEPYSPAPLQRSLLPDLPTGGVRAWFVPKDDAADGYTALTNSSSGFNNPFTDEVRSWTPASDTITVSTTPGAQVYGVVRSFRSGDLSLAQPEFYAKGGANLQYQTPSSQVVSYVGYSSNSSCHAIVFRNATMSPAEYWLRTCPKGACKSDSDWRHRSIMQEPGTETRDFKFALGKEFASFALATGTNVLYTEIPVPASCDVSGSAPSVRALPIPAGTGTHSPQHLAVTADATRVYVAFERRDSGNTEDQIIGSCAFASCNTSGTWTMNYVSAAGDNYLGGDLQIAGNYLFWAHRIDVTPPGTSSADGTYVWRCDHTASACALPANWGSAHRIATGLAVPRTGDLSYGDGRLMWVNGKNLYWCDDGTACDASSKWNVTTFSAEMLSMLDAEASILAASKKSLIFFGMGVGGFQMARCTSRCWDSAAWYGGFVGRSPEYGAPLQRSDGKGTYGSLGGLDEDRGELSVVYRFVPGTAADPTLPDAVRFSTGLAVDFDLTP